MIDMRRFTSNIDASGGLAACWLWCGWKTHDGYGRYGDPAVMAHHVTYATTVGPIPADLTIDHLCRNRLCVNPAHLEPVPHRINLLRSPFTLPSINAAKTHCPRGHAYSEENTYLRVKPKGLTARECRTCRRTPGRRVAA